MKLLCRDGGRLGRVTPGAVEVDNSLGEGKPEIQLILDREKVSDLGLNVAQISMASRYLVNGVVPFKFREGENEAMFVCGEVGDRNDLSDLSRILIPSIEGNQWSARVISSAELCCDFQ